ncbi:P-loop NTPase [Geotalea sp. SG265]|uniref:P-loop NTPase n=1 Tax=Geotalea sp. SG265 TaxID=2922867 RepID=UPI001FB035B4|nr:P-loop NTPase [Geotalea sp. SG265]
MTEDPSPGQPIPPQVPRVWAVGGGKGGVGKSVVATNLGVAVARLGLRCVLVDADLGGANLHTMLGVSAKKGLASIFNHESASLNDILIPTGIANLHLVSGAQALLDMANPKHAQKLKLLRQLFAIDADIILIDLSAGSSFNVIDFFNAAHDPIMVVAPTPTSIENAYHFLNAALHRRFMQAVAKAEVTELAKKALADKNANGLHSPRELLRYLCHEHPDAGSAIGSMMAGVRPKLIVNQVRREEDMHLGDQIAYACHDFYGVKLEYLGGLRSDDRVVSSILDRKPLQATQPACQFSTVIEGIAMRLINRDREAQHG